MGAGRAWTPRNGLKMVRNTDVGVADVSGLERPVWKSEVQARADFSVPSLSPGRALATTGRTELFF